MMKPWPKAGSRRLKKRLRILITCGPTREPLDPVRYLSNFSTGEMGFSLAREASRLGHKVTLLHGPVMVPADLSVRKRSFATTQELKGLLKGELKKHDILFMAAAVSDFRPSVRRFSKIKRQDRKHNGRPLTLRLVPNPDVLSSIARFRRHCVLVGFSVESRDLYRNALRKLREKSLDMIVGQNVGRGFSPFGDTLIDALILHREGAPIVLRRTSKRTLSRFLLKKALELWECRHRVIFSGNGGCEEKGDCHLR